MTKNQPSLSFVKSRLSTTPARLVDGEVEAEEAQVRLDLGAEQRELELHVELVRRHVLVEDYAVAVAVVQIAFCA